MTDQGMSKTILPGVALMTHNVFAGLAETNDILARHGLSARVVLATVTVLHPVKSVLLDPEVRASRRAGAVGLYDVLRRRGRL